MTATLGWIAGLAVIGSLVFAAGTAYRLARFLSWPRQIWRKPFFDVLLLIPLLSSLLAVPYLVGTVVSSPLLSVHLWQMLLVLSESLFAIALFATYVRRDFAMLLPLVPVTSAALVLGTFFAIYSTLTAWVPARAFARYSPVVATGFVALDVALVLQLGACVNGAPLFVPAFFIYLIACWLAASPAFRRRRREPPNGAGSPEVRKNRNGVEIAVDVLITVSRGSPTTARITSEANVPYCRLKPMLQHLEDQGLLLHVVNSGTMMRYGLTTKGWAFLNEFERFEDALRSYGFEGDSAVGPKQVPIRDPHWRPTPAAMAV